MVARRSPRSAGGGERVIEKQRSSPGMRFAPCAALLAACAALLAATAAHAAAPPPACLAEAVEVTAQRVDDARSITLVDGRVLRLAGIETFALLMPERADVEPALRAHLQTLAGAGLRAQIISQTPDRYGRLPALVATPAGVLLQESAARAGLAIALPAPEPLPCYERIVAAEDDARRAQVGFWSGVALPAAEPAALNGRIGQFAIFEGRILSVGNRPTRTYLNFGKRWSDDVTVSIRERDRDRFGGEAGLSALAGKRVRVRGFLEDHGGPSLEARSPFQIEVLDAGVGVPPDLEAVKVAP